MKYKITKQEKERLTKICNDLQVLVEGNEFLRAKIEDYFLEEKWRD